MKTCSRCQRSTGGFTKDASQKDGLSFYCKMCKKVIRAQTYVNAKVRILPKNKKWREANGPYTLWQSAKRRARQRGAPFTITVEDVKHVWPANNRCPVLDIELRMGSGAGPKSHSPSLDAFLPDLGYVPGNISVVSFLANSVKRDVTDPTVLERVAKWMLSKIR